MTHSHPSLLNLLLLCHTLQNPMCVHWTIYSMGCNLYFKKTTKRSCFFSTFKQGHMIQLLSEMLIWIICLVMHKWGLLFENCWDVILIWDLASWIRLPHNSSLHKAHLCYAIPMTVAVLFKNHSLSMNSTSWMLEFAIYMLNVFNTPCEFLHSMVVFLMICVLFLYSSCGLLAEDPLFKVCTAYCIHVLALSESPHNVYILQFFFKSKSCSALQWHTMDYNGTLLTCLTLF